VRRNRKNLRHGSRGESERGIVIVLVAVVMLFVVGAMAALSIDVVTLYTARSEAQLAADAGALAGARVLANSGMTSAATTAVGINAKPLAVAVATQVAASNQVGGRLLRSAGACSAAGEICVTIDTNAFNFLANPQVSVQVQRTDLPTFFARIWGRTTIGVKATATAEAYNPSNAPGTAATPPTPIAPTCVKPWLLPNKDPNPGGSTIFDPATGKISSGTTLLNGLPVATLMKTACGTTNPDCLGPLSPTTAWNYYPGAPADFPAPLAKDVVCLGCVGFNAYQRSIAGCVQTPISCAALVNIDTSPYPTRDDDTATAVNALTHSIANGGDSIDTISVPSPPPFQFLTGADNPVVLSGALPSQTDVMVSDSLVTVPVFDDAAAVATFPNVKLLGFVQLFMNPTGAASASGAGQTQVINMVGCGPTALGQPLLGNGSSPVVVRLISP
jgi:Flp pilus assembly protein TadG